MAVFETTSLTKPLVLLVDYTAKGPSYSLQSPYPKDQTKEIVTRWWRMVPRGNVVGHAPADDMLWNLSRGSQGVLSLSRVFPLSVEEIADAFTAVLLDYAKKAGIPVVVQLDNKNWHKGFSNIVISRAKQNIEAAVAGLRDAHVVEGNQAEASYLDRVATNLKNVSLTPMEVGMIALMLYGRYQKAKFRRPEAESFWLRAISALPKAVDDLRKFNPVRTLAGIRRRYAR